MSGASSPAGRREAVRAYDELRAELARMEAALSLTRRRYARLLARVTCEAEDAVIAARPRQRQSGRHKSAWTAADEREYARQFRACEARHERELAALELRAARQGAALIAFRARHRFNDPHPGSPHSVRGGGVKGGTG